MMIMIASYFATPKKSRIKIEEHITFKSKHITISGAESGLSFPFPLKVQIFEAFQKALLRIGTPFLFWLNLRITSERNSESIAQNRDSLSLLNPNSEGISCRTQNSISGYISLLRNRIQKFDFCYLSFLISLMIFVDFRRKSEGNLEEISTSRRNYNNKVFSFLFIIK
ncbi:hypothetical protein LXL04_036065 [Taraxacum kok-saghyz]